MADSIRDLRDGDFAWFNKSILKMGLGWKANLVYMGLVAFANGTSQACFPSKSTLASLLGVSKDTVSDGLKDLEKHLLISVEVRQSDGARDSNQYILLQVNIGSIGKGVGANSYHPPVANSKGVGANSYPNNKNEKEGKKNYSAEAVTSRFSPFKEAFCGYYQSRNGIPAPWNGREAKDLKVWLESNPTVSLEQWGAILRNRARSPVAHGNPLSAWIRYAASWLNGAAGEFGRPIEGGMNGKSGKINHNIQMLRDSLGQDQVCVDGDGVLPPGNDTRELSAALLESSIE